MAFGWDDAAMLVMMGLGLLGGKNNNKQTQESTQTTVTPPWTPKDPMYNIMSPYLTSMLAQNMGRLSGAGYPGGVGIGGDMTGDLINMISQSWPDIMKNATDPATATTTPKTFEEKKAACMTECANVTGNSGAEKEMNRVACLKKCMAALDSGKGSSDSPSLSRDSLRRATA
jgi:hypothetical protein